MDIINEIHRLAVLCIDNETETLELLKAEINKALHGKYLVETAEQAATALTTIEKLLARDYEIAVVICGHAPPSIRANELLRQIHTKLPYSLNVIFTAQNDVQMIINVINQATLYHYLPKPCSADELKTVVKNAIQTYIHNKTLRQQHETFKQLDALKDQFLANTSHELRTPLNGIIGASEFLRAELQDKLTEIQAEMLSIIIQGSNRLLHLVGDILDFSHLKNNAITPELKPFSIKPVINEILSGYQTLIKHHDLQLVQSIAEELPLIMADENRTHQILHNFMDNALKFTAKGQVEVSAEVVWRDPSVYLPNYSPDVLTKVDKYDINAENYYLAVHIKDSGIGIPKHKINRIFESFEQVDGSSARGYGGTGLGLTIVQQLLRLQYGEVFVRSTEGQGSCFTFILPLATQQQITAAKHSTQPVFKEKDSVILSLQSDILSAQYIDSLSRLKEERNSDCATILLIDDDFVNLRLLSIYLSTQPYEIITATSAEQALNLIDAGLRPDLIATDIMMPHKDGYQLTRELRQRWPANELPIILLSIKSESIDVIRGLEAGANDYLIKPIARDELVARIDNQLRLKFIINRNAVQEAESNIAKRIRQWVLPRQNELDKLKELDISGFMQPAKQAGGDYCDVLQYDKQVVCGIGDVVGQGLESSLLMLMVQTAMRTLLASHVSSPELCLKILNRALYESIQRMKIDKTITLALLNYHDGRLRFSGQHEIVLLVTKDAKIKHIDTTDLGFVVGLEPSIEQFISAMEVELREGDGVVLYSDGIIDACNANDEHYGLDRLCEVIKKNWYLNSSQVQQEIINDLRQHVGQESIHDDVTLLVIKKKAKQQQVK